ncbi:MAG: hypothetical protein IKY98_03285 [Alphaproteobacteria bacterium]|nr:hypothetical protein [Alphaproteobacteria bacterium]
MKKNLKSASSGRSMVEMLGVLAVVGVLSIGGIMGYSYGMDKYRANETTNQIMLRAIDLMTQAAQGNETLTLADWNNEANQYDFGDPIYTADDLIKLDVGTASNPIPKRVCEQIFEGMKSNALYIDINGKEMDVDPECDTNNTMTFYFEGGGSQMDVCNPACGENEYCDNGICFKGDKPIFTYWGCEEGECCGTSGDPYTNHGKVCTLADNSEGICHYGQCLKQGCTYTQNKCTNKNEYCASPNTSDYEAFPDGKTGTCVMADFKYHEVDGTIYYISNHFISWWDADAACKAMNKQMLSASELISTKITEYLGNGVWTKDKQVVSWDGRAEKSSLICYHGRHGCAVSAVCK